MGRLATITESRSQKAAREMLKNLEQRVASSPPGLCPVDLTRAYIDMCHAQTCGKCAPCRIGLGQLQKLLTDILDGTAGEDTIGLIEETALDIMQSADCAIGYEPARMVWNVIHNDRADFEYHIKNGRCSCKDNEPVPCVAYCPANVDIPGYIALCRAGRFDDAVRLIRRDNPFPSACAFICEHPCEAHCRRNMIDSPVNIRGIKRAAVDLAGNVPVPECGPSTGKKVAVIGGGPCGLSAAYYLRLMGHYVTVFEMLPEPGGMLRYGIPNYRLPKERLDEDINAIISAGVDVRCNVRIDREAFEKIRAEYDAVLVTIGASTGKRLGLSGEDRPGIMSAVELLRNIGLGKAPDLKGQKVAIIGGGNVAMDAVRTALRCGAEKADIVYRRRAADMTALPSEIEAAVAEGCGIRTLKAPSRLEFDDDGNLSGIWVTPQMIGEIKDGRASVRANGQPDELIECTTIIVAIGQDIESSEFEAAGIPAKRGRFMTSNDGSIKEAEGVFAEGDCASGPATVIKAVAAAKVAAANIDAWLGFDHRIPDDTVLPDPVVTDRIPCGRVELPEREAYDRKNDFDAIEGNMLPVEYRQECGRCLRCDCYGYGSFKGGHRSW